MTMIRGMIGAIIRFVLFMRTNLVSDITWDSVPTMTWTTAEPSLYLVAACLPALRPLLKEALQNSVFKSMTSRLALLGSKRGSTDRSKDPAEEKKKKTKNELDSASTGSSERIALGGIVFDYWRDQDGEFDVIDGELGV